jgi:hypothetical protein
MNDKKHINHESPNVKNMQAVVIDKNTTIYIALDADPVAARQRYLDRFKHLRP